MSRYRNMGDGLKNRYRRTSGKGELNRFGQSAPKRMMQQTEGPEIGRMSSSTFTPGGKRDVIMKGNRMEVPQGMCAGQQGENQQQKSGSCLQTVVAHGAKVAIMPDKI